MPYRKQRKSYELTSFILLLGTYGGSFVLNAVFYGFRHIKLENISDNMGFNPNSKRHIFTQVPIYSLQEEGEKGLTLKELCRNKVFWLMMIMMVCSGASEQAVSQWASTFAEQGLGVSKTVGDLAGPLAFAAFMGTSRLLYGKFGDKLNLNKCMFFSACLCVISYLCIALIPVPAIGLIGCALCGFSVGVLWPGTFSKSSAAIKRGGTVMFAMLALAGDLGCSGGPTLAGLVSGNFNNNLHIGILSAIIFPAIMLLCLLISKYKLSKS